MKNIIPFKHETIFKTNIDEILSISLENTLSLKNNTLSGEFIISGEYKETIDSEKEPFLIKLPFEELIDDKYDVRNATIDIDDFYYEIKNDKVLFVSIDIAIDKLEEKEKEERNIIEDTFNDSFVSDDSYVEYNVYILRDQDTIETILEKYNTSIESLKEYNDLDNLKIGDKIIIPKCNENT